MVTTPEKTSISCVLLPNSVSLKAHQGLIEGTYTAEFDHDVVGTLAATRYDEVDILYN